MFYKQTIDQERLAELPLRELAFLGDAVFHLASRELAMSHSKTADQMHKRVSLKVSAPKQAELLDQLTPIMTTAELDILRRARNLKSSGFKKGDRGQQSKATALEALLGYLYLTDETRLKELLAKAAAL